MISVLTIAGSDPTGGAGIQSDLATFQMHGMRGVSVVTAVTAQTDSEFLDAEAVSVRLVVAQLQAVFRSGDIIAAKTGMLATAQVVAAVADELSSKKIFLVVDPVMHSSSGAELLSKGGQQVMREKLFSLASLVTPNIPEAELLTGKKISSVEDMKLAAGMMLSSGAGAVLVKGGHALEGNVVTDVLCDAQGFTSFSSPRIDGPALHGTGCVLSAAIAANLAQGRRLSEAIERARAYLLEQRLKHVGSWRAVESSN